MCSCTGYCVCLGRNDSNLFGWVIAIVFVIIIGLLSWK